MNMDLVPTPSQTVGPFFHFSLTTEAHSIKRIAGLNAKGERIWVCCRVLDGEGSPVNDAMIEIWQADAEGRYPGPGSMADAECGGFGRLATGEDGSCEFETVKPGRVLSASDVRQAPHLEVAIFGRGMNKQLFTRIYFAGEAANPEDAVLALVPADRQETLMAHPDPVKPAHWRFDVHLQGEQETVFFDM
jgi:protocatechuate 3,4-dioxygenase, alpha subunit